MKSALLARTNDRGARDRMIFARPEWQCGWRETMRVLTVLRRSWLWLTAGVLIACALLVWGATQFGHASPSAKVKPEVMTQQQPVPLPPLSQGSSGTAAAVLGEQSGPSPAGPNPFVQGPALHVPEEVLLLLDQRKRSLDRREEMVKQQEERLLALRAELDKLLAQNEAIAQRIETTLAKEAQQTAIQKAAQAKALQAKERLAQEQRAQLARMYETMPPEDAAARLERMPERTAIQILRLVKTKTAGAILAQVKPEHAAKLTEQLLAQTP